MIDITAANFETEVLQASATVPVLVDFWAPWCAPCRALGPVLEKLETAYAGRFVLAKIDSDEQQSIAAMFGVRSIPTVVLLMGGQPVDGFTGALPEAQIRAFLDKHLPAADASAAQQSAMEVAQQALLAADAPAALAALQQALQEQPDDDAARFELVRLLLQLRRHDQAKAAFAPVAARASAVQRLGSLQQWMHAIDTCAQADMAALDAAIAANKRDFAARFERACALMAQQQWTAALDELLEILMRDKTWKEQAARKACIAILDIMQPPRSASPEGHIPQEDPVVARYRRRLSSLILS